MAISRAFTHGVALCVMSCVSTSSYAATRFVLAVGARAGLSHEEPLHYANADAQRFLDVFVDVGQVAPARATLLEDVDVKTFELQLARLTGQVEEAVRQGERVEVVLYASSHGDADALHLSGERYALKTLRERVEHMPAAAVVLVIDACRTTTAAMQRTKGAVVGPAFDVNLAREIAPSGFVVLHAARDGEAAQESDSMQGAFFTHHLVAGLRGAADFDHDGKVTLAEAWRHAHEATLAGSHASAAAQHPEIEEALMGEGELVLADLLSAKAQLVLPKGIAGNLLVVDARSSRVLLEVQKTSGTALTLALPARRVRVQLRPDAAPDVVRVGELALDWGGVHTLDESTLVTRTLVAALDKGSSVDETPWIVTVAAGASVSPFGFPSVLGDVTLERRLWQNPLFLRARVGTWRGETTSDASVPWTFVHIGAGAAVGVGTELWLGPVRGVLGADVGGWWLKQDGARVDNARLVRLGYHPQAVDTWAVGPSASVDAGVFMPLWFGFCVGVLGRTTGVVLPLDGALAVRAVLDARLALAWEF